MADDITGAVGFFKSFWTQILFIAAVIFGAGKFWNKHIALSERVGGLEKSNSELYRSKEEGGGFRFALLSVCDEKHRTCEERRKDMEANLTVVSSNLLSEIKKVGDSVKSSLDSTESEMRKALIQLAKISVHVEQQGKQIELSLERIHDMEINGDRRHHNT